MYKISVPIALESISDGDMRGSLEKYLDYFKKGNIERVFVCCFRPFIPINARHWRRKISLKTPFAFLRRTVWRSAYGSADSVTASD